MSSPYDLEELKKYRDKVSKDNGGGNSDDLPWYKLPKDGYSVIRFLPPWPLFKKPGLVVGTHWNLTEVDKLNCVKSHGLDCSICNVLDKYVDRVNVENWESQQRAYFNVLVLDDPSNPGLDKTKPMIMGASTYNLEWIIDQILNPLVGDITDPNVGFNVQFKRKKPNGPFDRTILPNPLPIAPTPEGVAAILNNLTVLTDIWKTPDDQYVMSINAAAVRLDNELGNLVNLPVGAGVSSAPPAINPSVTPQPAVVTPSLPVVEPTPQPVIDPAKASPPVPQPAVAVVPPKAKPASAPDCFGLSYDATNKTCVVCIHDFECQKSMGS